MKPIKNKVALVTGSNRGIGFAVVKSLLEEGFSVILTSRNSREGKKALSALPEENAYYHPLDVTSDQSATTLYEHVSQKFGRLDVLINNAGINYDTWQNAMTADLSEVEQTLDTNLIGPWRMMKTFLPLMQRNNFGRIVNVSSSAGALAALTGATPGYSVSKAALNALTISMAKQVRGSNILVNAVCPGWVRTEMGGAGAPKSPEEGAETIVWAALLPNDGKTASFFRDKKQIPW
ncbi:MAG: SDR family oxidoreductase [Bacteroidota bacterium]